MNMQANPTKKL